MPALHTYKHTKSILRHFTVSASVGADSKVIPIQIPDDITLYSGKRLLLIVGNTHITKSNAVWATFYRKHTLGNRNTQAELRTDKVIGSALATGETIGYYTTFTVETDNEALTEVDALNRLISQESQYDVSDDINMPLDYTTEGKSGLLEPESAYKLNRMQNEIRFKNILFSANTMKLVALIRIDKDDWNVTPYTVSATVAGKLTCKFTVYFDKNDFGNKTNDNNTQGTFVVVNSFWSSDKNLTLSVGADIERYSAENTSKDYLRIQIAFNIETTANVAISVQQFEKLENAKLGESLVQTFKADLKFNNQLSAVVYDQILGYSANARYSLPLSSEVVFLPKEITSGDLNDYKTSGYYFAKKESTDPFSISNRPMIGTYRIGDSFRLYIEELDGSVYQRFVSLSATESYQVRSVNDAGLETVTTMNAPREFERIYLSETNTWTEWNMVGRYLHSHKLQDMIASPLSLHFTQDMLDRIGDVESSTSSSPFKGPRVTTGQLPSPAGYMNGDVISFSNGGIYQLVSGNFVRIDIEGLHVFGVSDTSGAKKGLISDELYDKIFDNTFMKKLNANNVYVLVSNQDSYYNDGLENVYDMVLRTEAVGLGNRTVNIGFGTTKAGSENSVAIGYNVLQNSEGIGLGRDITNDGLFAAGIGLTVNSSQVAFGYYNKALSDSNAFIFGVGTEDTNRVNSGYIDSNGYLNFRGFKYYAETNPNTEVSNAPQKYVPRADGEFEDISNYATKQELKELDDSKVDKGNSTTLMVKTEDGKTYPFVLVLDPEIKLLTGPNGNNIAVAYGAGYIEFCDEGIRLVPDDPDAEDAYVTVAGSVTTDGNTKRVNCVFDEESQSYPVCNFSSVISADKMSGLGITNYPVSFDFNTYVVTYKGSETVDFSEYFAEDGEEQTVEEMAF